MSIIEEMIKSNSSALIDLYELDLRELEDFEPLNYELDYGSSLGTSILIETGWDIVSQAFYDIKLDDYSEINSYWNDIISSDKSWYYGNTDINNYLGIINSSVVPASIGDYYIDYNSPNAYLLSAYSSDNFIDFTGMELYNYGSLPNSNASDTVINTETITLTGNSWVAVDKTYTITEDTILELKFESTEQGKVHAIGLSDSLTTNKVVSYLNNYPLWYQDKQSNIFDTSPNSMCASSDCTDFYIARKDRGYIYQYITSTSNDISGLTYTNKKLDISSEDSFASGISLVNSGSTLFTAGWNNKRIYKYTLSTPEDISSATYSTQSLLIGSEIGVTTFNIQGLYVKEDGSELYFMINNSDITKNTIYQYTMSTPYDLSSATYTGKSEYIHRLLEPQDLYITSDGTYAYVVDYQYTQIFHYEMTTPWDITTIVGVGSWDTRDNYLTQEEYRLNSLFEDRITSVFLDSTGKFLYTIGNATDRLHQFSLYYSFQVDRNLYIDESEYIIQLYGYDNYGIDYKVGYTSGQLKYLIPIGKLYTGSMKYLFFGTSTEEDQEDAVSIFSDVSIYENSDPQFEEITRGEHDGFPSSSLFVASNDNIISFDLTKEKRPMWLNISNSEFNDLDILKVDISSGMLYVLTSSGIYEKDFIQDTSATLSSGLNLSNIKDFQVITIPYYNDTNRLNQPYPYVAYILENGTLKVRKEYDYVGTQTYTFVTCGIDYDTFNKIEITKNKELIGFTSSNVYYFGNIETLQDNFSPIKQYGVGYINEQSDNIFNNVGVVKDGYIAYANLDDQYAKISFDYNTGLYTSETIVACACESIEEEFDGDQYVLNPNFEQGTKYYTYGSGWVYANNSMMGASCSSELQQRVTIDKIEPYVLSINVSELQSGVVSLIFDNGIENTEISEQTPLIQYIVGSLGDQYSVPEISYLRELEDKNYEQFDIRDSGIYSFIVQPETFKPYIIVKGNNFNGIISSIKLESMASGKIEDKIHSKEIDVFGEMKCESISDASNMYKYSNGTITIQASSDYRYIYYWEFNGITWNFVYGDTNKSSNYFAGIYYVNCDKPKALVRLTSEKYTDKQIANILANEVKMFFNTSNVLLYSSGEEDSNNLQSLGFDDRVGVYYVESNNTIQKFNNLVCEGTLEYYGEIELIEAYNNNVTLNNQTTSTYVMYFYGDSNIVGESDQGVYRFYPGTNEFSNPVIWKNKIYVPFPVKFSGYELSADKEIPRPTLAVSNIGGLITDLIVKYDDILGGKVIRKRTFAKYLDAVNFKDGNPNADSTIEFPDVVFYINKKISETFEVVSFELAAKWDIEGVKLPRRIITYDTCPWEYRGDSCGYEGTNYFDLFGNKVVNESEDICGKKLTDCLKRFAGYVQDSEGTIYTKYTAIPFGGFPGVGM